MSDYSFGEPASTARRIGRRSGGIEGFLLTALLLFLSVMLAACPSSDATDQEAAVPFNPYDLFRLDSAVVQYRGENDELHLVWTIPDRETLWEAETEVPPSLRRYRNELAELVGDTSSAGMLALNGTMFHGPGSEDVRNPDSGMAGILAGTIGRHRPMNRLECALFAFQGDRYDMFRQPTEFHAFLLKRTAESEAEADSLRVYLAASSQEFPPRPDYAIDGLIADTARGWRLFGHLHNHTLNTDPQNGHLPVAAPSKPDRQYFGMLQDEFGLQHAFVADGFNTIELSSGDIRVLSGNQE